MQIWENGRSRVKEINYLVKTLAFLEVRYRVELVMQHIDGNKNHVADHLSRRFLPGAKMRKDLIDTSINELFKFSIYDKEFWMIDYTLFN